MRAPEDSWMYKSFPMFAEKQDFFGKEASSKKAKDDDDDSNRQAIYRAQRIIGNDLENIPIGLAILWLAALTCNSDSDASKYVATLVQVFVTARVAHTVTFMAGIGGLRTMIFMTGLTSVGLAMALIWKNVSAMA